MKRAWRARSRSMRAFTLVELLVCIAILVVLATAVFTMSGRMIRAAHRADSMKDMRELTTFVTIAAQENLGRYPHLHKDRNNPHHFNKRNPADPDATRGMLTLEDLIDMGLSKDTAFCKANTRWSSQADYYWNDFLGGQTAVFSYVYLANDNGWASDNSRFTRPDDERARTFGRNLNSLPATPSRMDEDQVWYPYIWADVCRRLGSDFLANFMTDDGEVDGMNIMHMDGHCKWKTRDEIKPRFTPGGTSFYW